MDVLGECRGQWMCWGSVGVVILRICGEARDWEADLKV